MSASGTRGAIADIISGVIPLLFWRPPVVCLCFEAPAKGKWDPRVQKNTAVRSVDTLPVPFKQLLKAQNGSCRLTDGGLGLTNGDGD